jgi:hypothetical protein
MDVFSRFFRTCSLAISVIFLFQIVSKMALSQRPVTPGAELPVSVVIRTDHGNSSLGDSVKLDVSLQNAGDAPTYVERGKAVPRASSMTL